ncbi:hypothetical protein [Gelidibacter algens]|uniref:hypothetical protein n=1 Tax=Gelidibacter algens TaxID=49280 RepID=UPI0012F73B32|nr:hypothetical protein [Gelidibacter algens]
MLRFLIGLITFSIIQSTSAQCEMLVELTKDLANPKTKQAFKNYIKGNDDGMYSYLQLAKAGRTELRTSVEALQAFTKLQKNEKLIKLGVSKGDLAGMLKKGWGGPPEIPAFNIFCDELNDLINILPVNTKNLKSYLGSEGFTNAASYTQRHSYLQLQRLLENKEILSKADEVIFESEISVSAFGIGNSVSDIHIVWQGRKLEVETKAGVNFFKGIDESNFMTQSGNSLMTVSNIEDYKVFLNPGLVDGVNKEASIKKVIDAWSKQSWFKETKIVDKFKKYGESKGFDFTDYTVEEYLKMKTEWFDEIIY